MSTQCVDMEAHFAHMEVNGECPWCGSHDPHQIEFGDILSDGTVVDRHGVVIEEASR